MHLHRTKFKLRFNIKYTFDMSSNLQMHAYISLLQKEETNFKNVVRSINNIHNIYNNYTFVDSDL